MSCSRVTAKPAKAKRFARASPPAFAGGRLRAAAVADMHRPDRIGGIARTSSIQAAGPSVRLMKPAPRPRLFQPACLCAVRRRSPPPARAASSAHLREHHRGIGRHIAVRRIARRLDHDARCVELAGTRPCSASATTAACVRDRMVEKMLVGMRSLTSFFDSRQWLP
jgi:hypothetical protein